MLQQPLARRVAGAARYAAAGEALPGALPLSSMRRRARGLRAAVNAFHRRSTTGFVTIKNSSRGTRGRLTPLRSVARPVVFIMRLNWRLKSLGAAPKKSGLRVAHLRKKLLSPAVLIISPTCAC